MFDGDVSVVTTTQPRVELVLELKQPSCLPLLPVIQQQFGGNIMQGGAELQWSAQQDVRAVLEATLLFLVKKRGWALEGIAILDIQAARALVGGTFTALQVTQLAQHAAAIRLANHND